MKTNYEIRYAAHPEDAKSYDTTRIRRDFLIEKIFVPNEVNMVYSMYDRMVVCRKFRTLRSVRLPNDWWKTVFVPNRAAQKDPHATFVKE